MDASELDEVLKRGEARSIEIEGACAFEGDTLPHLTKSIGTLANAFAGGTFMIDIENTACKVQSLSEV